MSKIDELERDVARIKRYFKEGLRVDLDLHEFEVPGLLPDGYDGMGVEQVAEFVAGADQETADAVLHHESTAPKPRKGVLEAAEERLRVLAGDVHSVRGREGP